jgi:hypothetical protein
MKKMELLLEEKIEELYGEILISTKVPKKNGRATLTQP